MVYEAQAGHIHLLDLTTGTALEEGGRTPEAFVAETGGRTGGSAYEALLGLATAELRKAGDGDCASNNCVSTRGTTTCA